MAVETTVEQPRRDIDAGRTGDKSPGVDPAAAPLGTDEEAAGTPVPAALAGQEIDRARDVGAGLDSRQNDPARPDGSPSREARRFFAPRLLVPALTLALAAGLSVAAALYLFR